jgi:hypothetical protein
MCLMQLKKCCMELFLVACDTCSCIKQVAKDSFFISELVITIIKTLNRKLHGNEKMVLILYKHLV